ncbi:MAG: hypothetical protein HY925_05350, partial [Elusimicrobia bacterium]|nr:hypothetical protein [Elusimicrobiota bacterium]
MELLISPAELEKARSAGAAKPESRPQSSNWAGAVFAAGMVSFLSLQRPAPKAAPEAPALPVPETRTQAASDVLVPFSTEPKLVAQYEDGLVPFSVFSPIVNEGPLPEAPAAHPLMTKAAAFRQAPDFDPAIGERPAQPMVEHAARKRDRLAPISLFGGRRLPDLSSREALDARAARGAAMWGALGGA